jgi:NAD-dependent dihydropyrimidine dehydrogenase PreA subunit
MIEFIVQDQCAQCNACVAICPTNVFDAIDGGIPVIARPEQCQTCFMCELYCDADAIYVGGDCLRIEGADQDAVRASGLMGQFRRDSGWGEWGDDPRYRNEHWRMEGIFLRARDVDQQRKAEASASQKLGV